MSVSVVHLTKKYGAQKAVDNLSFSIPKGGITGFLGPNGAGKSTTMKILTGYLFPTSGKAEVCGMDVDKHPLEVKRKVGYLSESNPLYSEMYVKELLNFTASVYQLSQKKRIIAKVIELTGLGKEAHKKVHALSKGYKQRLGLASVLLPDPEVLILDEPTSGLDPNQLSEIRQLIKQLGKEKTVLLSSHIMQEVEAVCDRAIIIHEGKIVADDSMENLRLQKEEQAVKVEFREEVSKAWFAPLREVEKITQETKFSWVLFTARPEALKKSLWQLALQNNLNIVSLQRAKASLEELFRKLTK